MVKVFLLSGLVTLPAVGAVLLLVGAVRRRLACMAGMMVAMALGMVTGLLVGAAAGAARPADLWAATIAGSGAGLAAGGAAGAMVGLMAFLDGTLSGLMGGMMGAMLAVMVPGHAGHLVTAASAAVLATAVALILLLAREVGAGPLWSAVAHLWSGPGARTLVVAMGAAVAFGLGMQPAAAPVREITVTARDFAFDLPAVQVARGERVRLRLRNLDAVAHDLDVAGLPAAVLAAPGGHGRGRVHAHAGPGEETLVEFVARAAGRFTAACTQPGHGGLGMSLPVAVR